MSQKPKDSIFTTDVIDKDFAFTEKVVEVFDDMIDRSVPFYDEVIRATAHLLSSTLRDNDEVVDLGCATGTTLLQFCRLISNNTIRYTGIDNSEAMLNKGRIKAENYSKEKQILFYNRDITTIKMHDVGAFIINYTMQFIRPLLREDFLTSIFASLRPGGVLFLSEKTILHNPVLNRKFIEIYHNYKKEKGYSELEIARKREALENVLIPFSIEENRNLLEKVGFTSVATYFQWFNFASLIAVKPG